MKILFLSDDFPPYSFGGAGLIAFDLAQAMRKDGHDVKIVTTVRDAALAGDLEYEGLKITRIATDYPGWLQAYIGLWNGTAVSRVKSILREFKPDVVHAHNVHGYLSYGSLKAAHASGARVILTCHDVMSFSQGKLIEFIDKKDLTVPSSFDYKLKPLEQLFSYRLRYNPLRNLMIRRTLRLYVGRIIAVSHALKQAMEDNGIMDVAVIHNAIDAAEWQEPASATSSFKDSHHIGDSAVLFGGRLSGIKGAHELIEALSIVVKDVPDVQLLVVGERNRYAERMLEIADENGLKDRIIFTGWLTGHDLHAAYHASAIAVTPSLCFDSFVMVNLEAMSCAKPAITACYGGAKEVVVDGLTGYVVNPFNVNMMAEKIVDLLKDRQKSEAFGKAGYERAVADFSLTKCVQDYKRIYTS